MRYWVFTTKPSHFRMSEALVPGATLDWPTFSRFKFEVGDLVFFYASSPVLQFIGKLEIERNDVPFSEVDPRNDLRKWPKTYSSIPWLRLRVLQAAPVPFKPLQRGSLYYHTEFKPSPYPKLLHEGEIDYVLRAFDQAMTYTSETTDYEGDIQPEARHLISGSQLLDETIARVRGAHISSIGYDRDGRKLSVGITDGDSESLTLTFHGVRRCSWSYELTDDTIASLSLKRQDIYLLAHFIGAELEVLAEGLKID